MADDKKVLRKKTKGKKLRGRQTSCTGNERIEIVIEEEKLEVKVKCHEQL